MRRRRPSVTGHASYCLHAVITRAGLDQWSATKPWLIVLIGTALVGSPLLVALVGLAGEHWHPVLDLAMTEFRVRDVGSDPHSFDRPAGADPAGAGPGKSPRAAQLLPARSGVPAARIVVVGAGGGDGGDPPRRRSPPRSGSGTGVPGGGESSRSGAARGCRDPGIRAAPADAAMEPVPAAAGLDRRVAGGVVGPLRRLGGPRPAGRRRVVLRSDPRAVSRSGRRDRRSAASCSSSCGLRRLRPSRS